jgi:hypothetical protein
MLTRPVMLALLLVGLAGFVPASRVKADGIGYFPSELTVTDALRGQRYETGSIIVNQTQIRLMFRLTGAGDIGPWLSFAPADHPEQLTNELIAKPNSQLRILVLVNIPDSAQNGTYTGEILMENFPPEGEHSDVVLAFRQGVKVTVSGAQKLSLQVGSAFTSDVEAGKILRIQAQVANLSNVDVVPSVAVAFQKKLPDGGFGEPIARVRADAEKIKAGQGGTVHSSWDTAGQAVGEYRAAVTVSAQGQDFGTSTVSFKIVPLGSLARGGAIASMVLVGKPPVGTIARVDITFENKGETEVQARFVGQVYFNGAIVSETASKVDATARTKESGVISTFFPVSKAGRYTLRGKVQYEGARTEEAALEFRVGNEPGGPGLIVPLGLGSVAVVVAASGGVGLWRRQRRSGGSD